MITTALLGVLRTVAGWLAAAMPAVALPQFLIGTGDGTLVGTLGSAVQAVSGVGPWLPASQLFLAAGFVGVCITAAGAVQLARIVASFLTLGGGGT